MLVVDKRSSMDVRISGKDHGNTERCGVRNEYEAQFRFLHQKSHSRRGCVSASGRPVLPRATVGRIVSESRPIREVTTCIRFSRHQFLHVGRVFVLVGEGATGNGMRGPVFVFAVYVLFALEASFLHHLQFPFSLQIWELMVACLAMTNPGLWTPLLVLERTLARRIRHGGANWSPRGGESSQFDRCWSGGRISFPSGLPVMILAFGAAIVAQLIGLP